jgi:hypothetical protein
MQKNTAGQGLICRDTAPAPELQYPERPGKSELTVALFLTNISAKSDY